MNKVAIIAILSSVLFSFGCVEPSNDGDTGNQERARCTAKCDEVISSLKVMEGLTLVEQDGKLGLSSDTIGELDEEVWIDILINGEIIETDMYPSKDGLTYKTRDGFELPAYEKFSVVAFGFVGEKQYERKFNFEGVETVGRDVSRRPFVCC